MGSAPPSMNQIEPLVRTQLDEAGVPGAAIALSIDGDVSAAGIGYRDLDRRVSLPPDARFFLYSITKLLLATVTMQLVEHGAVALDQPVAELLPDLPVKVPGTLRQVLDHTAGLPDYGAMPVYVRDLRADPAAPWTDDAYLTRTLRAGPLFPPGQGWAYSNVGYLLVRRVIERLTGGTLGDALDRLIFAPLGLRQTGVVATLDDARDVTPGYSRDLDADGAWHDVTRRYHPGWVAHGLVVSTAPELARILNTLFTGHLVTPASLDIMRQGVPVPGMHPPFRCPRYGLGLMLDPCSPVGSLAGHAGGGPGFATAAFHATTREKRDVTAIVLLNRDNPALATNVALLLLLHN